MSGSGTGQQTQSGTIQNVPLPNSVYIDPQTGTPSPAFYQFLFALWNRTGGSSSGNSTAAGIAALKSEVATLTGSVDEVTGVAALALLSIPDEVVGQSTGGSTSDDSAMALSMMLAGDVGSMSGSSDYDISGYYQGLVIPPLGKFTPLMPDPFTTLANPLWEWAVTRNVVLPAGLMGSSAQCGVAPTGAISMNIQHNGTTVGTMNFAASATVGTFTLSTALVLAPGDSLSLLPPSGTDATFANLFFTLSGTL